ncbi:MAG: 3-dehydroquinate synthase [Thermoanaerobaculia bacterium]
MSNAPPIVAGIGCLPQALADAREIFAGRAVFVISSPTVLRLHGAALEPMKALSGSFRLLEVPDGEAAKSLAVAGRLWEELARAGGRRDSRIVAFGGGSVGDLSGFVAASFLRGVDFVQIPTTLLAQVDAAIGGKTAIDLAAGKNLVGAFHQPLLVIADSAFLPTLPRAELRSGLVEVIKMAALLDVDLLAVVERDLAVLLAGDAGALAPVVQRAAAAKAGVVARDPFEAGERQLLNYGHTLGHALETAAGHGRLLHGDAVAWGMRFSHQLAAGRGADRDFLARIERLLDRLDIPPPVGPAVSPAALVEILARDKKARASGLTWILPMSPGNGQRTEGIPMSEVAAELARFLDVIATGPGPV